MNLDRAGADPKLLAKLLAGLYSWRRISPSPVSGYSGEVLTEEPP